MDSKTHLSPPTNAFNEMPRGYKSDRSQSVLSQTRTKDQGVAREGFARLWWVCVCIRRCLGWACRHASTVASEHGSPNQTVVGPELADLVQCSWIAGVVYPKNGKVLGK